MAGDSVYPQRPRYFAMKFIRLMVKECVAQEIGQVAYILLTVIATTEDAAGYRRSVSYYDGQLLPLLGVGSKSTISLARRKCIKAGWLHFEPGHRGKASRYWVTIPQKADGVDDLPTDEGDEAGIDTIIKSSFERKPNDSRTSSERIPNENRTLLPIPVPIPGAQPELEEKIDPKPRVLAEKFVFYWQERKSRGLTPRSAVELEPQFAEHLRRCPGNFDSILKEIESKHRNRNEWPDKLLGRFEPKGGYHQPAPPSAALPDANDFYAQKQAEYQAALKSEQQGEQHD